MTKSQLIQAQTAALMPLVRLYRVQALCRALQPLDIRPRPKPT
jgi:hypothetical protein